MGYLDNFFCVYASHDTRANVLCFSDIEDMYDITYVPKEGFTVHSPDQDITLQWCGKLYAADFAQQGAVYVTRAFMKAEIEQAKTAYELI